MDVSSLGWHVKYAKFLISENRTRCFFFGLDLQSQMGVQTTQIRPARPLLGEISNRTLMKRQDFGDRLSKRSTNKFFLASVELKLIKFSRFSSHRLFLFNKLEAGHCSYSR